MAPYTTPLAMFLLNGQILYMVGLRKRLFNTYFDATSVAARLRRSGASLLRTPGVLSTLCVYKKKWSLRCLPRSSRRGRSRHVSASGPHPTKRSPRDWPPRLGAQRLAAQRSDVQRLDVQTGATGFMFGLRWSFEHADAGGIDGGDDARRRDPGGPDVAKRSGSGVRLNRAMRHELFRSGTWRRPDESRLRCLRGAYYPGCSAAMASRRAPFRSGTGQQY